MEVGGAPSDSVTVAVVGTATHFWVANDAAAVDVSFDTASWTVTLAVAATGEDGATVTLGHITALGVFTAVSDPVTFLMDGTSTETLTVGSAFTVSAGDFLALRIVDELDGLAQTSTEVTTDGDSVLVSPASDPGYPVFELGSILLLGASLLMVGAFVAIRRRHGRGEEE
jgi:hypothetical protein